MERRKIAKRHLPILEKYGLSDIDITGIQELLFQQNELLFTANYPCEYLLIVLSGRVRVSITCENGKSILLAFYNKEGLLGDAELMSDNKNAISTVQAITDVSCIGIPLSRYFAYLKKNTAFLNCIGAMLAQKLNSCSHNCAVNILHPLEARLCTYIDMVQQEGLFHDNMTVLAELLGTSYRHLLRTIDSLCQQGILHKEAYSYRIMDDGRLKEKKEDCYYL